MQKCSCGLGLRDSGSNILGLSMGGAFQAIRMTVILHLDQAQKQDLNVDPIRKDLGVKFRRTII